jgi:hypothetical protein
MVWPFVNEKKREANVGVTVQVTCDGPGCNAVRSDVNHWFVVNMAGECFCCEQFYPRYKLGKRDHVVCGQRCAQKLLEKYFGAQNAEKTRALRAAGN